MKQRNDKYKKCTRENANRIAGILETGNIVHFGVFGKVATLVFLLEEDERLVIRVRIYSSHAIDGRHVGHLYDILCSVCRRTKWKYFVIGKSNKNAIEVRFEL